MKIRCDVCDKEEASVFCTADEASLCDGCDHRVHHANKLASKHLRFSLLHPSSSNSSPICDICQEKKALLFCQQDRAILCKDCDSSIHSANEHTKKHDRFLLTGVKLSATSSVYKPTTESPSSSQDCSVPAPFKKPISAPQSQIKNSRIQPSKISSDVGMNQWGSTSTISEYLIDTLPGWHVEDFLDSSLPPYGFSKSGDDDGVLPYMEAKMTALTETTTIQCHFHLRIWGFGSLRFHKLFLPHTQTSTFLRTTIFSLGFTTTKTHHQKYRLILHYKT
ncbi:hypothetical protein Bca52824_084505 [Brassica carinata]|uniref:B box-type domain-containing protein n=1 Tax=Brassica carinata TaxID=52824 RepID=A0A8X7TUM2_BRACI|nr:hypothetical protein Bca52824_084505 [Brassica carinata]